MGTLNCWWDIKLLTGTLNCWRDIKLLTGTLNCWWGHSNWKVISLFDYCIETMRKPTYSAPICTVAACLASRCPSPGVLHQMPFFCLRLWLVWSRSLFQPASTALTGSSVTTGHVIKRATRSLTVDVIRIIVIATSPTSPRNCLCRRSASTMSSVPWSTYDSVNMTLLDRLFFFSVECASLRKLFYLCVFACP